MTWPALDYGNWALREQWAHEAELEAAESAREEAEERRYLEALEMMLIECLRCGVLTENIYCDDCESDRDWERMQEMACADLDALESEEEE